MPSARTKKARAKQWYATNKEHACAAHRKYYSANAEKCKETSKLAYENKKDSYKKAYANDPEKFKEASKKTYANDPEKFKEASKKRYANDPEKFKEASKKAYVNDPEKFKEASKKAYVNDPEKFKEASFISNRLYLTQFDPASIIVSTSCLEEINRLRSIYRKDLSLYDVPKTKNSCKKRRFTIRIDEEAPPLKKPCMDKQKCKRKTSTQEESPKTKKAKTQDGKNDDDIIYTGTVSTVSCQRTTWHNL